MVDGNKDMHKKIIHVLIVNLNNLFFTKDLLNDLSRQSYPFKLTLIDNCSEEEGTKEFFEELNYQFIHKKILFDVKVDLNRLWNGLFLSSDADYLCFLNNDIRIPSNFIEDTVNIFDKEPEVGIVVHATNHLDYQSVKDLEYRIMPYKFVQGWDFTVRAGSFSMIPDDLKVFGGDDYIFNHYYKMGWKAAVALSSPVIHFYGRSRKYFDGDRKEETENFQKYFPERLPYGSVYSNRRPTFNKIIEKGEI
jgi:hypothetical protein